MKLTIADIIECLGGATIIAERLTAKGMHTTRDAVSKWKHVDKIPHKYWPNLIEMSATLRPLTGDDLLAAHTGGGYETN